MIDLTTEALVLALLLVVFVFCLGFGLGMGYREKYPLLPDHPVIPAPADEEIMIFERVTFALSQLPSIEEPKALHASHDEVMRSVGEQYGLRSDEVEAIYRRVWNWRHGNRR